MATDVQLNGDLANIDQIRFYVRDPEAVNEVKTIVIDKIEGVDRFSDDVIITSVNENYNSISDLSFKLQQNYPNPFNPTTTIQYSIKNDGMVSLKVYNIIGQEVVSLVNGFKKAGYHQVNFDASKLASGVYIYQIQSGSFVSAKKMLLMK
ncbi:MAG: T9SS type A sorting domain-containing protein [Bacteroidetes bacterium]|nr:T9SS type A sorting domain-containing protein [Bacteroidota bacterium]